jgi:hypothetical protein
MKPIELAKIRSDLVHMIRFGAEETGKMFTDREEDWDPMIIGSDASGKVTVVGLDPTFLSSEAGKQMLADEVLPELIRKQSFVALGMVISAWMRVYEKGEYKEWPGALPPVRPSQDAKRIEILIVSGVDRYGDELYTAKIVRHPQGPPTLEPWVRLGGDGGATGRMIEPLRSALRPQG